jgi:hypothetical protein
MGLLKPRASVKTPSTGREPRPAKYRAVEIRCSESACEAAKAECGKRHLSGDVSLLPLKECDRRDRCDCTYRHHQDRRDRLDRRGEGQPVMREAVKAERRGKKVRRAEDRSDDETAVEAQLSLDDTSYNHLRR